MSYIEYKECGAVVERIDKYIDLINEANETGYYFNSFPGGTWMYSVTYMNRLHALVAYDLGAIEWIDTP